MAVRIPAWKAIGLKLKNGTGDARPLDDQIARPAKRRRTETSLDANGIRPNSNGIDTASTAEILPDRKRKKSVSFTNDTKSEDGDTRTTIDFPPGYQGSAPSAQSTTDTIQPNADKDNSEKPPKKRKDKSVKPKRNGSTVQKPKNALDYLSQFDTDRASWKFNKNQDSWILTHALSATDIPTTYNYALCAYIHGLPAQAGARTRLTQQCEATLQSGDDGRIGSEDREQHGKVLSEILGGTDSPERTAKFEDWLSNESRPMLLLYALGVDPVTKMRAASGSQNGTGTSSERPKKKKSRTLAAVDLSSSDESSSDESSSEDTTSDEETSSSGSSSDSE